MLSPALLLVISAFLFTVVFFLIRLKKEKKNLKEENRLLKPGVIDNKRGALHQHTTEIYSRVVASITRDFSRGIEE